MITLKKIIKLLETILELLKLQSILQKEVLTLEEACLYMGISESHMYKLTSSGTLAGFRPNGKMLYFTRNEINEWLTRHRLMSKDEIDQQVSNYLNNNSFLQKRA